jgi:CTP synthase (UTP-ammonia lyase)
VAGMRISGWDADREARIVELPSHPFFLGMLFVPQTRSMRGAPHAVITSFCRAVLERAPSNTTVLTKGAN